MKNLKKEYGDFEQKVLRELRNKIESSNYISKHTNEKAIKVNMLNYTEIAILNDRLVFHDNNGYEYSLYNNICLETLIDILNDIQ